VNSEADSPFFKYIKDTERKYEQYMCQLVCYQKKNIEKCGCYDIEYPQLPSHPVTKECQL
jgi:hypothetical protein